MNTNKDIDSLLKNASTYYNAIDCREDEAPDAILWSLELDAAIKLHKSGDLKDEPLASIFSAHSVNLAAAGYPLQAQVYKNAAASLRLKH